MLCAVKFKTASFWFPCFFHIETQYTSTHWSWKKDNFPAQDLRHPSGLWMQWRTSTATPRHTPVPTSHQLCSNLAYSSHSHTCLRSLSLAMQVLSQPIPTHTLPVHPSSHVGLLFLFVFEFCYLDMFLVNLPVCLLTCVPACCSACKLLQ